MSGSDKKPEARLDDQTLKNVLHILLDEKLGKPWILQKLARDGFIGAGDIEVYKATTKALCDGIEKALGTSGNEDLKAKLRTLKEKLAIIQSHGAELSKMLAHSMIPSEVLCFSKGEAQNTVAVGRKSEDP